jgi:hypothetical protein
LDWAIYISQLLNPLVGITGAVPLGLGVLKLPLIGVAALVVPVNLVQAGLVHALWQALLRRPRVRAWLERRRNERVSGWLQSRGAFAAAVLAGFLLGCMPAYVSLRFLGAPAVPVFGGMAIGVAGFGAMVVGACRAAGL